MVAGGGILGPEIWSRFVELAGGPEAPIVVIPTAGTEDHYPDDWAGLDGLRSAGARNIRILHTRSRETASSEEFVRPLREAAAVWFPGGRQWRLVDAYLGTRTHDELLRLLDRGGVIGGTSAGASIQGSFLVRGDPASNQIVVSPDYEEGFGFLREAAVDQHLIARNREEDLWQVLSLRPDLLGIGVDEGTAVVIQGDRAQVIGTSRVVLYDASGPMPQTRILKPGDVADLGQRRSDVIAPEEAGAGSHHP